MRKKGIKRKRRKLKLKAIFTFLALFIILFLTIYFIMHKNITNIYIIGNNIYSDEEIINLADIKDYPELCKDKINSIEKSLEKEKLIKRAIVKRKGLFKIYITVYENYPLFYHKDKTYLKDLDTVSEKYATPNIINDIPDLKFEEFCDCIKLVDLDILSRISEIKYDPNEVDDERFLLTMNDGIYVYVTLNKFDKINNYDDIAITLDNKKGILYLDNGEYFEVFNE